MNSPEYRLLVDWIAAGAPGPRPDDTRVQRLEVFPAAAILKPKDTLQVVVRAWYGAGRSEDVTRWARFASSEDLVATVDEDGQVTVAGHGEAAVTVVYANLVALCGVSSPYPDKIDPAVFANSPRHNFIDELVLKKLQALNIPPSGPCTD